VVRLFVNKYPHYTIVNVDALTYAGNLNNLTDVENAPNYSFKKCDIVNAEAVNNLFATEQFDAVIHLAAESHVDRSIADPLSFINTNIIGTVNLLNAYRTYITPKQSASSRFYHISTDEVYGSLGAEGFFTEETSYDPRSPYSASKASSDHLVRAYHHTYKLPVVLSNCSNNYGPNQFPEKLIPLAINNIKNNKPIPVYGKGDNVRDWLYVVDHARAIDTIFHEAAIGTTYNIGGFNEWKNIDLIHLLCTVMDEELGRKAGTSVQLITYVTDRAGHDQRYAIDASMIQRNLGWEPSLQFEQGLRQTVQWYLQNGEWLESIANGTYQEKLNNSISMNQFTEHNNIKYYTTEIIDTNSVLEEHEIDIIKPKLLGPDEKGGKCLENAITTGKETNTKCIEGFVQIIVPNGKEIEVVVIRHCWNKKDGKHFDTTKDYCWKNLDIIERTYYIVGEFSPNEYISNTNFLSNAVSIAEELNLELNKEKNN
jgi:dTDP-glucose 4,6-dehydratase